MKERHQSIFICTMHDPTPKRLDPQGHTRKTGELMHSLSKASGSEIRLQKSVVVLHQQQTCRERNTTHNSAQKNEISKNKPSPGLKTSIFKTLKKM